MKTAQTRQKYRLLPNRQQAHPNNRARNIEGVYGQMRHGESNNQPHPKGVSQTNSARCRLNKIHCMQSNAGLLQQDQQPTNKIPIYEKILQAEGNRQQATGNRQQAIIHIF